MYCAHRVCGRYQLSCLIVGKLLFMPHSVRDAGAASVCVIAVQHLPVGVRHAQQASIFRIGACRRRIGNKPPCRIMPVLISVAKTVRRFL